MSIYLIIACLLTITYVVILLVFIRGWRALPEWNTLKKSFTTTITVLVPARNEEQSILDCLNAISNQNYPKELLEIVVIDDHSTDNTAALVKSFPTNNLKLLHLSDFIKEEETTAFKKKALEAAINEATSTLIVTTDADCTMGEDWLGYIASYYEVHQPKFIAAPVVFQGEKTLFQLFQSLDFAGMMGVTGAGIHHQFLHMCNGANLAFERKAFQTVGGYKESTRLLLVMICFYSKKWPAISQGKLVLLSKWRQAH